MTSFLRTLTLFRCFVTAVSKYRNCDRSEDKSSSRNFDNYESKNEDRIDKEQRCRRSQSRENSLDRDRSRDRGIRDDRATSRNSREDPSAGSDDERRGRGKHEPTHSRRSFDDNNSTGSNGSRGRASRLPNTNDDHRKGGNLNYPDASTAARMHSHISGEPDERVSW